MLNKKSFLAVDCGATNVKLAEFELTEAGGLLLKEYGFKSLGQDGTQEATREPAMIKALQELLSEKSVGSRLVNICAPGYHTFSKFVKLPPVDTSKVTQIIQYEAQQNVPFPLEEVVWDYQILGATPTGELEVLLVAIKSDIVEGLFRTAESAGMRLNLVDVSPAALCNAFRYNYADLEGCTMLLDIGAKTSNLLFFEKGNVYSRGINIGANSITQEFSRESKLGYDEAERTKVEQGFVSLGGAYEEPENAHQAAISKIARQVLTRLHIQVNQTIQFYRGQQGGSPPERLFLSGGATSMPYTAQFFSEKLNLPVEYFNPLRNLQIDPGLNREELAKVAHSMGEVVGLGLRNLARCPVELNLMPKSSLKRQEFNQKKPYLVAAAFCLILIVWAAAGFYNRVAGEKEKALQKLKDQLGPLASHEQQLRDAVSVMKRVQYETDEYTDWLEDRWYWANVLTALRDSLVSVEEKKEKDFSPAKVGVWVEKLVPVMPAGYLTAGTAELPAGLRPAGDAPPPPVRPQRGARGARAAAAAATPTDGGGPKEVTAVLLTCRSVNLANVRPEANTLVAEAVAEELKTRTNYFNPEGTKVTGEIIGGEGTNLVIQFQVTARLTRPVGL
jgi:type IV pilus assembly protein PilM